MKALGSAELNAEGDAVSAFTSWQITGVGAHNVEAAMKVVNQQAFKKTCWSEDIKKMSVVGCLNLLAIAKW